MQGLRAEATTSSNAFAAAGLGRMCRYLSLCGEVGLGRCRLGWCGLNIINTSVMHFTGLKVWVSRVIRVSEVNTRISQINFWF